MPNSAKLTHSLVDIAMGRKPADLVIRNGQWVCVQSGEIIPHTDVAIVGGHIAFVGPDAKHTIGKDTQVIEARDAILFRVCSTRTCTLNPVWSQSRSLCVRLSRMDDRPCSSDPHEMANIFGLKASN